MNGGTSYVQMAAGTIVRVPVVSTNDVVTINFAGNAGYCTLSSSHTATQAEVEQGYVEFGVSENSTYINSISVELAYMPAVKPVVAWDWEHDTSIQTFTTIQYGSGTTTGSFDMTVNGVVYTLVVDCTTGGKFGPNENVPQFTTGAKLQVPVTSTSDVVTIKRYGTNDDGKKVVIRENDYTDVITNYTAVAADVTQGYVEITSGCNYLYSVTLTKNEYFATLSVGDTGWATFASGKILDFTNTAGIDAYIVTGHNSWTTIVKEQMTGTVPANTGLLINAAEGTYAIPVAASSTTNVSENKLVQGPDGDVSEVYGVTRYVLSKVGSTAAFKHIGSSSANVPSNKAYLEFTGAPTSREFLNIEGDVTGINEMEDVKSKKDDVYYDLNGRRVLNPTKGLYIVNGNKVILK